MWLGMTDIGIKGSFRYTDLSYPLWIIWDSNYPQPVHDQGTCAYLSKTHDFRNDNCTGIRQIVCELPRSGKLKLYLCYFQGYYPEIIHCKGDDCSGQFKDNVTVAS